MKRRSAFTLLEMLVVMGGLGVVMLLTVRCTHLVVLQTAISREFADCDRQWSHLSDVYRRDVHAARKAEAKPDGSSLRLFLSEDRIATYAAYSKGIERSEESSGKKSPPARYRLWDGSPRYSLNPEKTYATLVYLWTPPSARVAKDAGQSPPSHELRLEAAIGSDLRFSPPQ